MNLTVIRKDGTIYDLSNLGIKTLDFIVSSPEYRTQYEEIDGADGVIDLGTTIGARILTGKFQFTAHDLLDYPLLRNEIFRIFSSKESFYLIDERESGKRWEVKCNTVFKPEQILHYGFFDLDFICGKGYAESIGTTLDPLTFDSELWQTGQGLTLDETMYTHSTSTFQIYNAADGVTIDPRTIPLTIAFQGASTNLKIKNVTNGDEWAYTGTSNIGDEIKLDGIRSTKNGLTIFRNTNHKIITLAPGYNDFQLTGTSGSFTISFAFRFYTL
ncbi:phage-related protein [Neobacillus niacini]|uniref:phage tail family protein n=1 Tax=Neobacillus niacini TaxID=86668 RepID=UPI00277DBAEF|nr:phage tail family protein [Neobacillus niacini]MDQ1003961.1 phage-related protein [Neobacillus niacini]